MHFTLWPSRTSSEGRYADVSWDSFLSFLASPRVAPDKNALPAWSPVRFRENRRGVEHVEAVSCLGLDADEIGLSITGLYEQWQHYAGAIHTTHSHTEAEPRHRIVLRLSRDITAEEYYVIGNVLRAGQNFDKVAKDPARLWYIPAHREGAPYEWIALQGTPIDVDQILATRADYDREEAPKERGNVPKSPPLPGPVAVGSRRQAMALALGAAWPAKGRHEAQLALAGALRSEGFPPDEALEVLCAVCRAAGDEDRPKREATIAHTYAADVFTGWTRLKALVDPVVVDAARGALARGATFEEGTRRLLAELGDSANAVHTSVSDRSGDSNSVLRSSNATQVDDLAAWGVIDWTKDDPPVPWLVHGIIQEGTVSLAYGLPNSLKTWTTYQIAAAVAAGVPWLGRVTRPGLVVLLDYESSERQARRRMRLLQAVASGIRYINPTEQLTDEKLWIRLARLKPALVIADSLARGTLTEDENAVEMQVPLDFGKRLSRVCNASTIFIHHKNKSGGQGQGSVRGSSAIYAAAEGALEFLNFERVDGDVQRARLHCDRLKEWTAFEDIYLELSNAKGLVEVPKPDEKEDESTSTLQKNRTIVLSALRAHSAGISKANLVAAMKGKKEAKFELLSQMVISGELAEFQSERKDYLMINPRNLNLSNLP